MEPEKNMSSSSEAFEKFSIWKRSKTPLKVTSYLKGTLKETLLGSMFKVDAEDEMVAVLHEGERYASFGLEGAMFSVEPCRIVATRDESDWVVFEESLDMRTHSVQ
jgi:hypothetical protein